MDSGLLGFNLSWKRRPEQRSKVPMTAATVCLLLLPAAAHSKALGAARSTGSVGVVAAARARSAKADWRRGGVANREGLQEVVGVGGVAKWARLCGQWGGE